MTCSSGFRGEVRRRAASTVAVATLLGGLLAAGPVGRAQESENTDESLKRLEARVKALEAQLGVGDGLESPVVTAEPAESLVAATEGPVFALPQGFERRQLQSERDDSVEGVGDDNDLDGLTNGEEAQLRTDPANPDSDGDALLDGWEVHGVNGIDLRALGASPLHKDIFVEMDFMVRATAGNGLGPNAAVLNRIRESFAAAQVSNPDGASGINIHLEVGNQVPYDGDLNPYASEFFALKGAHFAPARAPVFHYMIWANGYNGGGSSGISISIPHSDFLVTLGLWNNGAGGTDDQKVGTFIHELGHNLGLTHGGAGDHANYKPNHLSVMNYSFQTIGIPVFGSRRFDYQRFSLPPLREEFLQEGAGLGSSQLSGYSTIIAPAREVQAHAAIDWNNSGAIDSGSVRADLNSDNFVGILSATPDQWNSIVYNGGSIGSVAGLENALDNAETNFAPFPYVELTEEMVVVPAP